MKKCLLITLGILFAGNVLASPNDASIKLPLEGIGEVKPDQEIRLSMAPIKNEVIYDINCKINNPYTQSIIMRFNYACSTGGSFSNFKLNGSTLQTNQGYILPKANNEVVVRVSAWQPKESAIIFTNLDHDEPLFVHDCVATPAVGSHK